MDRDNRVGIKHVGPITMITMLIRRKKKMQKRSLYSRFPHASYCITARVITAGADIYARQSWTDTFRWSSDERIIEGSTRVTASYIAYLYRNLGGLRALVDHRGGVTIAEMMARVDNHGRLPLH